MKNIDISLTKFDGVDFQLIINIIILSQILTMKEE